LDLQLYLPVQSVPITTKVVSLNPAHGVVYLIQQYVTKFAYKYIYYSFSYHGFEFYDSMMCAVNVKGETKTFEVP